MLGLGKIAGLQYCDNGLKRKMRMNHPDQQPASSFAFNRPTIIALLYLASPLLGVTAIIGVVLAYVWRNEAHDEWESSHYSYLITTFWLFFIGTCISVVLMLALVGFLLIAAVGIQALVRSVLVMVNAQKQAAMPSSGTWLA
jgi:uncharacterized membrane protein